ncbi:FecR family protein [Microbulbifer litoralis]|uniref:FecR family protein n=1 Tax=Microbulbifer litoralis TaxID=2933965 RepID=UPI0020284D78|nr:FecR domain-containing protein [Microbulbifer sp. GX H0434]
METANRGMAAAREEWVPAKADTAHLERAADWMLWLEAAPDDRRLRRDLDTWLAADRQHRQAWQKVCNTWALLGDMPADRQQWPAEQARPPHRFPRRRTLVSLAVAATVLLALLPLTLPLWSADYRSGIAETRTLSLPDGTLVTLGADSAIDEDFSSGQRRVRLLRGEAFFDVAEDRRPFTVQMDELLARDIGTAFAVRAGEPLVAVAVSEGEVRVTDRASGNQDSPYRLLAGDQITIDRDSGVVQRFRLPPDRVALWRRGRLFVQDRPVADLVDTLERHAPGYILVLDDTLARHRITGSYDLSNVDGALSAIVQPRGGRVLHLTPFLRILLGPE